jgi:phage baseplate assembly protein W
VQGSADIAQCILIILTTVKGSNPLRPNFGCGLYERIDQPINVAGPGMVLDIVEAIRLYEPRVTLQKVRWFSVDNQQIKFSVQWTDSYSTNINTLNFTP